MKHLKLKQEADTLVQLRNCIQASSPEQDRQEQSTVDHMIITSHNSLCHRFGMCQKGFGVCASDVMSRNVKTAAVIWSHILPLPPLWKYHDQGPW